MENDVQQTYYEWQHGELSEQENSQGPSISQMLDHGSISFGRFAIESLSWEKRSVFTHNERQAELEKFKSPGLVAKKKAYFEEYYKKIRSLKAMQNQQTELSLEYGADGSISSQTGDEDEPPLPRTRSKHMPESDSLTPLEDPTAKETIKPHTSYNVVKEVNYNSSVHVQISDPESMVHRLSTGSSVEIKLNENNHDVKWTYKDDTKLKMEPDLSPLVCLNDPKISNATKTYFIPVDNPVQEKIKLIAHKPKEDPISVPMPKEHASARYLSKSVNKSLSVGIKSSHGSKHPLQKIIDKAEIDITLRTKPSSQDRSSSKSSFVASHRSPTEVLNKVYIPRPGSLSKERKGAIPTDSSELILRPHSKVSSTSASGRFNPKGQLRAQGDSRESATQNIVTNRALQSKSMGHGELKKNMYNKCSTVEGRATTEQLKARSINLPSRNNHNPSENISYQYGSLASGYKSKKGDSRESATHNTVNNRVLQSKSIGHGELKKNMYNKCSTVEGRATTEQLKARSINLPSRNNHNPSENISYQYGSLASGYKSKKKQVKTIQKHEDLFGVKKSRENPRWR